MAIVQFFFDPEVKNFVGCGFRYYVLVGLKVLFQFLIFNKQLKTKYLISFYTFDPLIKFNLL